MLKPAWVPLKRELLRSLESQRTRSPESTVVPVAESAGRDTCCRGECLPWPFCAPRSWVGCQHEVYVGTTMMLPFTAPFAQGCNSLGGIKA